MTSLPRDIVTVRSDADTSETRTAPATSTRWNAARLPLAQDTGETPTTGVSTSTTMPTSMQVLFSDPIDHPNDLVMTPTSTIDGEKPSGLAISSTETSPKSAEHTTIEERIIEAATAEATMADTHMIEATPARAPVAEGSMAETPAQHTNEQIGEQTDKQETGTYAASASSNGSPPNTPKLSMAELLPSSVKPVEQKTDEEIEREKLPEAEQIRLQVEYYFSDDNLATDRFLLQKMKGPDNEPVSIGIIHGFNKMKKFKQYDAVVAALKDSKVLTVTKKKGKLCVSRITPFLAAPKVVKEPKKKKSSQPTGFEEYYTEPLLNPEQAALDESAYHPDLPFAERIETAIQRYQARRKMSPTRLDVFVKWMKYGGIDTGPKQFTGRIDKSMLEGKSADEIASITATSFVPDAMFNTGPDAIAEVDFLNVAKGFLTQIAPLQLPWTSKAEVTECVGVLINFYNYIIHHNVCPEYDSELRECLALCRFLEDELWRCVEAYRAFPGNFNLAVSCLFGERRCYFDGEGLRVWQATESEGRFSASTSIKMAEHVFCAGLVNITVDQYLIGRSEEEKKRHVWTQIGSPVDGAPACLWLEVIRKEPSDDDEETNHLYENLPATEGQDLQRVGKLFCKKWEHHRWRTIVMDQLIPVSPVGDIVYEFIVEDEILALLDPGMKIEAEVFRLNHGLLYFENIISVHSQHTTVLPNELMYDFKEPEEIPREEWLEKQASRGLDDYSDAGLEDLFE